MLNVIVYVLVYPGNKAQSDDSSSPSKDVGASSIYHVRSIIIKFGIAL